MRHDAFEALFCLDFAADLLTAAKTQKAWPLCDQIISKLAMKPDLKAVGPLVDVLAADTFACLSPEVVGFAVQTLDKIGWKPARIEDAPAVYMRIKILEYIKNGQSDVCVQLGESAIPHLLDLLRCNVPPRSYANTEAIAICDILKKIGAPAVEPLIAAIGSRRDQEYKSFDCYLVQTLGRINNSQAYTFLMNNMLDRNVQHWVRRASILALGEIGHGAANAADALLDILNTETERPSSWGGSGATSEDYVPSNAWLEEMVGDIRIAAATTLGQIGDFRAVEPLIVLYEKDLNRFLRTAAISALGNLGGLRAVNMLLSALNICLNDFNRSEEAITIV